MNNLKDLTSKLYLYSEQEIHRIKLIATSLTHENALGLWLDLTKPAIFENEVPLILEEVKTQVQWQLMYKLRYDIEKNFGVTNPKTISQMLDDIKRIQDALSGRWYLARSDAFGPVIGEIGLIKFTHEKSTIGRLQDVDIAPQHQKHGYGRQLLASIVKIAREEKIDALCLKADINDWPLSWYQRLGFQIIF
ncbi:MAG: GNAT family N-acetyltransferase [Oligoflexales bacterium]|nr:GNAT family N-acetyltransferase [Oligoflexales bacterium]